MRKSRRSFLSLLQSRRYTGSKRGVAGSKTGPSCPWFRFRALHASSATKCVPKMLQGSSPERLKHQHPGACRGDAGLQHQTPDASRGAGSNERRVSARRSASRTGPHWPRALGPPAPRRLPGYWISCCVWWPMASPVVSRPKTRNGCAEAWYLTSFLMGSGRKNLNWKKICGRRPRAQG